MIARYHCPILDCRWSHDAVASDFPAGISADPLHWPTSAWSLVADWTSQAVATVKTVDTHLVTHSPVEWMTELRRRNRRIESLEKLCRQLAAALYLTGLDSVTTIPSRAEVESIREQLAGLVGTAVCDG